MREWTTLATARAHGEAGREAGPGRAWDSLGPRSRGSFRSVCGRAAQLPVGGVDLPVGLRWEAGQLWGQLRGWRPIHTRS